SIVDPNAVIAEGYQKDLMLKDFAETLSAEELNQLVSYLSGEVGLAERLAHPGVHLLLLILLFNGGITWAMRRAAVAEASGSGEAAARKPPWAWLGILGAAVLIGVVYLALQAGDSEPPPAGEPAPAQAPASAPEATPETGSAPEASGETALAGASLDGEALFKVTCPACHGQEAKGVPGLGKDMTTSEFIKERSNEELVEFIKQGRTADDPLNTTGVAMPPKGLNVALSDDEILAIVEYIRTLSE
ncbi:MAG: cytochrome c, partial [Acidobacteria bacterium]|nr:cytochrome c [Acidobacteriota bacterium]